MNKNFLITLSLIITLCLGQATSNLSVDLTVPPVSFSPLPQTTTAPPTLPSEQNIQITATTSTKPAVVPPAQPNQATTGSQTNKAVNSANGHVQQHTAASHWTNFQSANTRQQNPSAPGSANQVPSLNTQQRHEASVNGPLEVRFYPHSSQKRTPSLQNVEEKLKQSNLVIEHQKPSSKKQTDAKDNSSIPASNQAKPQAHSHVSQNGSELKNHTEGGRLPEMYAHRSFSNHQQQNHHYNVEQKQFEQSKNHYRNQNHDERGEDNCDERLPRRHSQPHNEQYNGHQERGYSQRRGHWEEEDQHYTPRRQFNHQQYGHSNGYSRSQGSRYQRSENEHNRYNYDDQERSYHRRPAPRPRFEDEEDDQRESYNVRRNHLSREYDSRDQDRFQERRYSQHNERRSRRNHKQYEENESEQFYPRTSRRFQNNREDYQPSRNQRRSSSYRSHPHSNQDQQEERGYRRERYD